MSTLGEVPLFCCRWRHSLWAGFACGLGSAACLPAAVFECTDSSQCQAGQGHGVCEPNGHCSYPDGQCASNRRFDGLAGAVKGECVEVQEPGTTTGTSTLTDTLSSSVSGDAADAESAATLTHDSGSGDPLHCGDGRPGPGESCDDANDVNGDGCNNDCRPSGEEVWSLVEEGQPGLTQDKGLALLPRGDGTFVLAGQVHVPPSAGGDDSQGGVNLWLRKYDAAGEHQWTWTRDGDGAPGGEDVAWALAPSAAGFLVAGYVEGVETEFDSWLAEFTWDGALTWEVVLDAAGLRDSARGIAETANGDLIVSGRAGHEPGRTQIYAFRYSRSEAQIVWDYRVPASLQESSGRAFGGGMLSDNMFLTLGVIRRLTPQGQPGNLGATLFTLGPEGDLLWPAEDSLAEVSNEESLWQDFAVLAGGDVLITGEAGPTGNTDIRIRRLDPAGGMVLWEDIWAGPAGENDKGNAIVALSDGGFVVAAEVGTGGISTDGWLRRYSAADVVLWEQPILSGPAGRRDTLYGLAEAENGDILVSGYTELELDNFDTWLGRYTN